MCPEDLHQVLAELVDRVSAFCWLGILVENVVQKRSISVSSQNAQQFLVGFASGLVWVAVRLVRWLLPSGMTPHLL